MVKPVTREHEVMGLFAHGKTGPMIAEELFISENTERTHIKRIYAKMGVSKKADMLAEIERIELP
ncbi:MAG: helix-turn-helix transcriptional regulator [Eggerthellaceae bacterium]